MSIPGVISERIAIYYEPTCRVRGGQVNYPPAPSGGAANASRLAVNHNPPSTTSV